MDDKEIKVIQDRVDEILSWIKEAVISKKAENLMNPQKWMDAALSLDSLLLDEKKIAEYMRRAVAVRRLAIMNAQAKRNVAAANLEIEASQEYLDMKIQEHRVDTIEEMIRLAKKNADLNSFNH